MFRRVLPWLMGLQTASLFAQGMAVGQTQDFLRNKDAVESFAKDNPQAAASLQGAKSLVGNNPQAQQQLLDLAADVFGTMVVEDSDPEKVQRALADYKSNPEALLNKMTPDQRAKVKSLANSIDGQSPQQSRP